MLPFKHIERYINEITGPEGVFNTSHLTLARLYRAHGKVAVDLAVSSYFKGASEMKTGTLIKTGELVRAVEYIGKGVDPHGPDHVLVVFPDQPGRSAVVKRKGTVRWGAK